MIMCTHTFKCGNNYKQYFIRDGLILGYCIKRSIISSFKVSAKNSNRSFNTKVHKFLKTVEPLTPENVRAIPYFTILNIPKTIQRSK